jgi:hypothetical protein
MEIMRVVPIASGKTKLQDGHWRRMRTRGKIKLSKAERLIQRLNNWVDRYEFEKLIIAVTLILILINAYITLR